MSNARSLLLGEQTSSAMNRPDAGVVALEPITGNGCRDCLDETTIGNGVAKAIGSRVTCRICETTYKSVEVTGDLRSFAEAVLDKSITPPHGEFDRDPGVVELSKKYTKELHVQTVAFLKSKWKDVKRARSWTRRNGYHVRKMASTRLYHTYVQLPKAWVAKGSVRVIQFGNGIRAVVGRMKPEFVGKDINDSDLNEPASPVRHTAARLSGE